MAARGVTGAVDIGGTKIAVGAVDSQGRILAKKEMPTDAAGGFSASMDRVCQMLADIRQDTGVELCGIGIGCTGPIDPISGLIGDVDFLPGWNGCNPVDRIGQAFGLKVAMENDADAAVLAEAYWGVGQSMESIICVTVGTGIGAGIVLNGVLYRGVGGSHPEIGHHVIDRTGPRCFCGAAGDPLHESLTAKHICDLARTGDRDAVAEVQREGSYLGIGVANLVTLFAPQLIILGGSIMNAADLFMPPIRAAVSRNCGLVDWRQTTIMPASLGSDTPLIGAGMVWRHRYEGVVAAC